MGVDAAYLSSTEIYPVGNPFWRSSGELPRAIAGMNGVSIDNKIIMTG